LQTGPESEIDAPSSERTWLQHICCTLITPDVLRREKRGSPEKEEMTEREDGVNQVDFQTRVTGIQN
jgi:hypothetical protein